MQKQTATPNAKSNPVQIDAKGSAPKDPRLARLAQLEAEIAQKAAEKAKRDAERKERETRRMTDLDTAPAAAPAVVVTRALDLADATQEYAAALRCEAGSVLQAASFDNLRNAHRHAATAVEIAKNATVGKRDKLVKGSDRHFALVQLLTTAAE